eukprot:TRINITY_DN75587_c0_g1_i1.p1 TRINITY_DN75587_c0_g1~~TRINITY_DN75587_c0_g1_i1.p1  ORF type:complete len:610 (-),score=72.74 TRINITY_DN75587_c0_g1_i1:64-1815(-)
MAASPGSSSPRDLTVSPRTTVRASPNLALRTDSSPRSEAAWSPVGSRSPRGSESPRSPKGSRSPKSGSWGSSSPRLTDSSKHGNKKKIRQCFPRCNCCYWVCPCFICCQPDALLDREEAIMKIEAGKSGRKASKSLVKEQLRLDSDRMKEHKRKWKRRWIICAAFCSCTVTAAFIVAIVYLAVGSWTLVNQNCDWDGRAHFGALYTPVGRIVVAGGTDGSKNMADVWESTDEGSTWRLVVSTASFGPRHGHVFLHEKVSDLLFVIAGDMAGVGGANVRLVNDVWSSGNGQEWTLRTGNAPWEARKFHGAFADSDGQLFVLGGMSSSGRGSFNDLWVSADLGKTWDVVALGSPWTARHSFALAWVPEAGPKGQLYILGGQDGRAQHDVWTSSDRGITWRLMRFTHVRETTFKSIEQRAPWSPRFGMAASAPDKRLIVMGGIDDDGHSKQVWQLDNLGLSSSDGSIDGPRRMEKPPEWKLEAAPEWTARWGHQSFLGKDGVPHILGGLGIDGVKRDIWKRETSIDINNLRLFAESLGPSSVAGAGFGSFSDAADEEIAEQPTNDVEASNASEASNANSSNVSSEG